jgi:hypothetical protein
MPAQAGIQLAAFCTTMLDTETLTVLEEPQIPFEVKKS